MDKVLMNYVCIVMFFVVMIVFFMGIGFMIGG